MTGQHASSAPPATVPGSTSDLGTWRQVRRFLKLLGAPVELVAFVLLSAVASVAEAAVILLVVAGASGVAEGTGDVRLDVGPVDATMSLDAALWLGVAGTVVLVASRLSAGYLAARLSSRVLYTSRDRLVRGLLDTSWAQQSSLTAARFQDLLSVQALRMANLVAITSGFLTGAIAFTAMLVTALLVEPVTAMALVVVGAVLGLLFRPITRRLRRLSFGHLEQHHQYIGHVASLFGVLPEIRIYGVQAPAEERHDQVSRQVVEHFRQMKFAGSVQPAIYLGMVMFLLIAGVAVVSARGTMDVALIGAIVLVLLRGLRYSQQAQSKWQHAVELLPYLTDFEDVLASWSAGRPRTWGDRTLDRVGTMQFEDVHYTYPSGDAGLQGVDLELPFGRIVGLAGPSGAGKSTLAQVVLGLREPSRGTYLVDGVPSTAFDERSWFSRFAYVAQHPILLEGDIADNVRFLRDCDDDAVASALTAAAMDVDLSTWADGSGRHVGAHGSEVSGGQRQRIAIARALIGQPDVLVLDEPTSALDPDTERAIRETLHRLRGRLTVVLIAHRESTLEVCDVVVSMQDGRVVSVDERAPAARGGQR